MAEAANWITEAGSSIVTGPAKAFASISALDWPTTTRHRWRALITVPMPMVVACVGTLSIESKFSSAYRCRLISSIFGVKGCEEMPSAQGSALGLGLGLRVSVRVRNRGRVKVRVRLGLAG